MLTAERGGEITKIGSRGGREAEKHENPERELDNCPEGMSDVVLDGVLNREMTVTERLIKLCVWWVLANIC